uniref:Uncharacterized protein n=1 Tax=Pseudenhygromyxa salsuginis TaxID=442868 RepID=A0A3S7UVC5_9BACT|nr:hypothetical protein [Pseudenhygromyxa salsuginis]
MSTGRRRFLERSLGLLTLGVGGCKIEPIGELPPSRDAERFEFPKLPPRIPEQLEDAEATLQQLADELLAVEVPRLTTGDLRERQIGDEAPLQHLQQLLASFGLQPAGPRGGWRQALELRSTEPSGDPAAVVLRSPAAPVGVRLPPPPGTQVEPDTPPAPPESPPDAPPETPESPDSPPEAPLPSPEPSVNLAPHGAFRQPGSPSVRAGLLSTTIFAAGDKLPRESVAGRVVWLRMGKDFDAQTAEAPDQIDDVVGSARDAGVLGCVLLCEDSGPGIERLRERWSRSLRRAEDIVGDELLLVGIVGAEGSRLVEASLAVGEPRLVDVDLGTREVAIATYNLMARIVGRERPGEAVILTCAWDTPDLLQQERDTLRLLATIAAFAQLASWVQRSTRPYRSLLLLLTADGGIGAGQLEHARWSAEEGVRPTMILALDRPTGGEIGPAVLVSGHIDEATAAVDKAVVGREGRDLLIADQLAMPELAPYLRHQLPVMTVGEPPADALEGFVPSERVRGAESPEASGETGDEMGDEGTETGGEDEGLVQELDAPGPREGLHADIRLLRNLMLALGASRA